MNYNWPGNVRELENVVERSMVLAEKDVLTMEILPPELLRQSSGPARDDVFFWDEFSIKSNAKKLEKQLIIKALAETKGNKTKASSLLEISLPALLYKIKEYTIEG
jgi:two-component system response regulator AtoC